MCIGTRCIHGSLNVPIMCVLISVIACVFIVVSLQDGDFNLMIVARYLHWYNDDARPGTSMEAFLLFSPRSCYGF